MLPLALRMDAACLPALQPLDLGIGQLFWKVADGVVVGDARTGRIALWNPAAERIFGYSAEEAVGMSIEALIPEPYRPRHREAIARYTETGEPGAILGAHAAVELPALRKSGEEIVVELSLNAIDGPPPGRFVLGLIRDVTERRWAQKAAERNAAELARSNADLEQFAYVASHDLQEPLRMIVSYLQLLERRYRGRLDADADDFIHYAVDGAKRMQTLINDLLTYSRAGRRKREFAPVDMGAVFDRAVANLRAAVEESEAVVTRDADLPLVMGDAGQLGQLLQNLVANAIKFRGPEPPRVHLAVERREHEWVFSLSDNGIGISPEFFERIFVIFQRLHSHQRYPGTGIGLAICKRIVERHGGKLWVESQPDRGSTFHFTLPIEVDSQEPAVEGAGSRPRSAVDR